MMSISAITSTKPVDNVVPTAKIKAAESISSDSFSAIVASHGNGTPYSDDQVKAFFASKPNQEQIAMQAASLGLNEAQIMAAMQTAGFGGSDPAALKSVIDGFVSAHGDAFAWGSDGVLQQATKAIPKSVSTFDRSKAAVNQLKMQSAAWTNQGMTVGEQADRARAAGVDGLTLSKLLSDGRLSNIADAYPTGLTGVIDKTGRNIPVAEVKAFFATNPSNDTMYNTWDAMGLNSNQMQHLMAIKNGVQFVPTGMIGKYDYAGNYTDPYYGSDAFTGGRTINGSPTGNRYGDATTKLGSTAAATTGSKISTTA